MAPTSDSSVITASNTVLLMVTEILEDISKVLRPHRHRDLDQMGHIIKTHLHQDLKQALQELLVVLVMIHIQDLVSGLD